MDDRGAGDTGATCTACIVHNGHIISMTRDYSPLLGAESVATCQCGWQRRSPVVPRDVHREAIIRHWIEKVTSPYPNDKRAGAA